LIIISFNPYFSGSVTGTWLIRYRRFQKECFNPYFSGSVTGTNQKEIKKNIKLCFNPYFSGSVTGTKGRHHLYNQPSKVSILILVDQSLEHPCSTFFFP